MRWRDWLTAFVESLVFTPGLATSHPRLGGYDLIQYLTPTGARDSAMPDRNRGLRPKESRTCPTHPALRSPRLWRASLGYLYFMMEGSIDSAYLGIDFWIDHAVRPQQDDEHRVKSTCPFGQSIAFTT